MQALGQQDVFFRQGAHSRLQEKLGAHPRTSGGAAGVRFSVWAPEAERADRQALDKPWSTPQDFMALVDHLHRRGIGVVQDRVPTHVPDDEHGPCYDHGTRLSEHGGRENLGAVEFLRTPHSLSLTLPPLSILFLRPETDTDGGDDDGGATEGLVDD